MSSWIDDELARIEAADELYIATARADGSLRNPVTIWVVRIGDELFVRAVRGTSGKWYGHAMASGKGRIEAGGVSKEVGLIKADDSRQGDIDAAYQSKYDRYGSRIVGSTLTAQAREATIKLVPLDDARH